MNKLLVTLAVGSLSVLTSANAADVLFVTGSPDLEKSNASRVITQLVQEKVPGVEIVRTDKIKLNSPEDIERERNRVSNAKIIVFHYPVYWSHRLLSSRTIWTAFTLSDLHTMLTAAS